MKIFNRVIRITLVLNYGIKYEISFMIKNIYEKISSVKIVYEKTIYDKKGNKLGIGELFVI